MEDRKGLVKAKELSEAAVKGIQEKKGQDIVVLNLTSVKNSIADYFVICTGSSDTHVDALADSVEKEISIIAKQNLWHREGKQNKEWILLDYIDVVIHIFKKEIRDFYALEDMWGDAVLTEIHAEF